MEIMAKEILEGNPFLNASRALAIARISSCNSRVLIKLIVIPSHLHKFDMKYT